MCGIAGVIGKTDRELGSSIQDMTDALHHRGPDDCGVWLDRNHGVALGHRRLSILDLSPAGHQPMVSGCGRYVVVFNGEIYNHKNLRAVIGEWNWHGHSDTETLLAGFSVWGIAKTVQQAAGMFAIAVWDRMEATLHLIRDRMGEKPLYYGWCGGAFIFGSELKALRRYPGFSDVSNSIDRNVLAMYLRFSSIPAPYSIYCNVFKLEAGCWLSISEAGAMSPPVSTPRAGFLGKGLAIRRWWSLRDTVEEGCANPISDSKTAEIELEERLRKVIREQSIADVPLGAFLSGGVDSSLIAALMQSEAVSQVRTFTIGFSEKSHNEADHAREVARYLGTQHESLFVSATQARDLIPSLPILYDEPFADSSQIPTFLVCQQARRFISVALSGDGGDELFGGYNRYFWSRKIWDRFAKVPWPARKALSTIVARANTELLGRAATFAAQRSSNDGVSLIGDKVHKLTELAGRAQSMGDFYRILVSEWNEPNALVIDGQEYVSLLDRPSEWPVLPSEENQMMYLDAMTYLPDDILVKVDRAAMGVGLETRVPFLDHRIVELAWQFPLSMKIHDGVGKWPLRNILYKYVPRELIERPKQGFSIPLAEWLRGPLREWAEHLLDEQRLIAEGFFRAREVRQKWADHLSGKRNWQYQLWNILMFQAWLENEMHSNSKFTRNTDGQGSFSGLVGTNPVQCNED